MISGTECLTRISLGKAFTSWGKIHEGLIAVTGDIIDHKNILKDV
jgi:hypothetical protein